MTTATLGSVAEFVNGAAFKPEDWGESGARIIRIQNLTDPSKPFNRTTRDVADKIKVRPGDLLVSWSATLGVFEWNGPDEAILNQPIFRVIPDDDRVEKRYLKHALTVAITDMQRHLHGATMQHVNRNDFLNTRFHLPPKREQRRIADILDRADALRAKRRAAVAQLDTLTQSIFLDMFGTERRPQWGIAELRDVVKEGTIVTYGIVQAGDEFPGGVPYIRTGDIIDGEISEEGLRHTDPQTASRFGRSRVEAGDIVMSIRATVGTTALVPPSLDGANLTQGTARISPGSRVDGSYLLHLLRSPSAQHWIAQQIKGATFREITLARLRQLPVTVPPMPLQRNFAQRVDTANRLRTISRKSLGELDVLFASLQHRAFRGEL